MDVFQVEEDFASSICEMADAELLALLELHEDLKDNNGIELYIYLCLQVYRRHSSRDHLQRAVDRAQEWIAMTPNNDSDRERRVQILDYTLATNIQNMTAFANDAYARDETRENHAASLFNSYELTGNVDNLHRAIKVMESLVSDTQSSDQRRVAQLEQFGQYLGVRFEHIRSPNDLHKAIEVSEQALGLVGHDSERQRAILSQLGWLLAKRAEKLGSGELGRAIEVTELALAITPQHDVGGSVRMMQMLTKLLKFRYTREGRVNDLNRAIDFGERSLAMAPPSFPNGLRAKMLHELADGLGNRYTHNQNIGDLNRAIELDERAVAATPPNAAFLPIIQRGLAKWQGLRFLRFGKVEDLNRSIEIAQSAVVALPTGHPHRSDCLDTLGNKFGDRYEHFGDPEDLDLAIKCIQEAVSLCSPSEPGRAMKLSNLATWHGVRFERTGNIQDLNTAIDHASEAVQCPSHHTQKAMILGILGTWLVKRFELTGAKVDLDYAIDMKRKAVDSTAVGNLSRAGELNDLGALYGFRFQRMGAIEYLREAIKTLELAFAETPQDHPLWPNILSNLSIFLREAYKHDNNGKMDQLDRSIDFGNKALKATSSTNTLRFGIMLNHGNHLREKYRDGHELKHLIQSISILKRAVAEIPLDHSLRGGLLCSLGESYEERKPAAEEDIDYALSAYEKSCSCLNAPPRVRLMAIRLAAAIYTSRSSWAKASRLVEQAIDLLPALISQSLRNSDKQYMLKEIWGLAGMAAALALHDGKTPYQALRSLERGRNVIANLMLGMRTDISELEEKRPDLASEFSSARRILNLPPALSKEAALWMSQSKEQFEAEQIFNKVLETIRAQPGFVNFLDGPSLENCLETARSGPIVVINMHTLRCDAFLIKEDGITLVELHDLVAVVTTQFSGTDRVKIPADWLWEKIAGPILDELGFTQPPLNDNWPRIWWIPTGGLFTRFPPHAAGLGHNSNENVIDRVMSSYSTSVGALIYARRMKPQVFGPGNSIPKRALLMSMEKTPGYSDLYFASKEIEAVDILCPSLGLASFKTLPERKDLLAGLKSCNVFHFAGHGNTDQDDPSQSGLVLDGDRLTVSDLWDSNIHNTAPYLSYLSACSTGVSETRQLADESIHLISGFQLAGFRHVVGTLWEVSDPHCVEVASVFYKTMIENMENGGEMTDRSVCWSLHKALRMLRAGQIEEKMRRDGKLKLKKTQVDQVVSFHWLPFVHFGP